MARTIELTVPDIGNFTDIPVIEVLVEPGQTIAKDAPLVTLESDKATMEVPASNGGTVKDVRVKVGDKVSKGSVLATAEVEDAQPAAQAAAQAPRPAPPQGAPQAAPPPPAETAQPPTATTTARPTPPSPATLIAPSGNGTSAPAVPHGQIHASPSIRRFARELGVDLGSVRGSGPNGRITRDDVQTFVKRALAGGTVAGAPGIASGLPAWPKIDFAQFGPIERKPLTRIQKISGPALSRNWAMIPHVTQNEDADVTELEEFRKTLNAEQRDAKVTMLAFLIKASIAALVRFPDFNSSLDGEELVVKQYYHIGFAADTPNGLVVPVIRDADRKGVFEIARETAELAAKARDGKLGPAEMQGGTFTISSLGGIGGSNFTPIINAPEVAILGASRTSMKPVWDGNAFVPRLMLPLSLSYDHRVIDGAKGARFITYLATVLADMRRTLL